MSLGVTKDCFVAPTKCNNCESKQGCNETKRIKKVTDFKRCANCLLMAYCDADCQKEHWIKVHRKHCRFLSGKTPVKNKHDAANCVLCIKERETSPYLLKSETSPKTSCHIKVVDIYMKKFFSIFFGFHREGKKLHCSIECGFQLPFPYGEVSGKYMEFASTGMDAMLAHSMKICHAMVTKAKDEACKTALLGYPGLLHDIMKGRAVLWRDILVFGKPICHPTQHLIEQVNSLLTFYKPSDPWWNILEFSVNMFVKTDDFIGSNINDADNLEDPRFKQFKRCYDYRKSRLQNQATVCEKKMWSNFMFWPQLVNGSLAVLSPPGTRCHSCNSEVFGEVVMSCLKVKDDNDLMFLPRLYPEVSENGALTAFCSSVKSPSCTTDYVNKNVELRLMENQGNEVTKEKNLFEIRARSCDFCLKLSLSSHRCSDCLAVQYCSTDCQKEDLGFHNTVCATWAKDKSRQVLSKREQKKHWKKLQKKIINGSA